MSHFFWPSTCPVCGRLGTASCPHCLDSLLSRMPDRCLFCGGGPYPCGIPSHLTYARAGTWHEGLGRDVVHLAKYSGRRNLAFEMGKALARLYREEKGSILVPVPLHRDSTRLFNQAEWIARGMSEVWEADVLDGLRWSKPVPSQVGRNAFERRAIQKGAFSWNLVEVKQPVFLVDDVFTTGTTLLRAAETLAQSGIFVKGAYSWGLSPIEALTVKWKEDAVLV